MTDRLKPTDPPTPPAVAGISDGAVSPHEVLDFTPTAKPADTVVPDAAGVLSFAPAVDITSGPIIIDEDELARDFSSAFHIAAGKRDSQEFPIPDLYKDHE